MQGIRPRDRLDRRLDAGRLRGRHVRAVARALVAFHAALRAGDAAEPHDEATASRVGAIHGRLACDAVWVGKRRTVRFAEPLPDARGDVAEDLATLAADLRARGAARRAEQLLAAYASAADETGIYRALERPAHAGRPLLIATGGRVASGKSTLAKALARRLAVPLVVADTIREALAAPLPIGVVHEIAWDPGFVARIYEALLARAEPVLASGRSVVLDAGFACAAQRRAAAARADRFGARFVFVHCDPPEDEITARISKREARDGGGWHALASAAKWEPIGPDEPGRHLRFAGGPLESRTLRTLERSLREPA